MKFNIISHITTSCNYNCSYCDVIKDAKKIRPEDREEIINFIIKNQNYIGDFKFFGGEPLLAFEDIKYIIENSKLKIKHDFFEIVTNTSLIKKYHLDYFLKNLKIIYLSVDNENLFRDDLFYTIISNYYSLEKKIYINLIIDPNKIKESKEIFDKLYNLGFRGYNLLPVYFTKSWSKKNLHDLSIFIKYILDLSIKDDTVRMYGFVNGKGKESKLSYNSLFIDTDKNIYYSDMVSTFMGNKHKDKLYIGEISDLDLAKITNGIIDSKKQILFQIESRITNSVLGQKELQKIMNYLSKYLKHSNEK